LAYLLVYGEVKPIMYQQIERDRNMNLTEFLMGETENRRGYKRIYNNLNEENYWLEWTDDNSNVWHFEYNSYSEGIPDAEYKKIIDLLSANGLVYVYSLPEKRNDVVNNFRKG
jgi:hypothetical protein